MGYISCIIQDAEWNVLIAVIPFFAAFSIYNMNRKTDEDEDEVNRLDRYSFTKRYEKYLYFGAILSLVLALVLSASHGVMALLATAAPFVCGMLYSFRILPDRCGYRRLKEIPGVKNITVGFAWGILLALLPVFMNGGTPDGRTAMVFLLFFMWGFMASLIPDIRDMRGDAAAGINTLPVLYGTEKTVSILTAVLLLIGIPMAIAGLLYLPMVPALMIIAAILYSLGCTYLVGRTGLLDFLADIVSDGQYIFFAIVSASMILLNPLL